MVLTKLSLWFYQVWKTEKTAKMLKLFIFSTFGAYVNVKTSLMTIKFSWASLAFLKKDVSLSKNSFKFSWEGGW